MNSVRIVLDLKYMKKGIESPKALFNRIFSLSQDYITTADIMRTSYGIRVSLQPKDLS